MKNNYTFFLFLISFLSSAQVLYTENFDGLNVGDVGTDITGTNLGQGSFFTIATGAPGASNSDFRIQSETYRGKVLVIEGAKVDIRDENAYRTRMVKKNDLQGLWQSRNQKNEILKYEYYFFTEKKIYQTGRKVSVVAHAVDKCKLLDVSFDGYSKNLDFGNNTLFALIENKWVKIITYFDFVNCEIYYEIPSLNYVIKSKSILLPGSGEVHEIDDFTLSLSGYDHFNDNYLAKFDDIVISAVNSIPKLNNPNIELSKFMIYPNPAVDVITISNNENIKMEEINFFDINGKLVKNIKVNDEEEINVDVSKLNSGLYLVYISTREGVMINKIQKKINL